MNSENNSTVIWQHKEECHLHRKPIDCFDGFAFQIGLSSLGHRLLVACSTFVGSGAQTHQRWAKMGPQSIMQVKPEILRRELSVTRLCWASGTVLEASLTLHGRLPVLYFTAKST